MQPDKPNLEKLYKTREVAEYFDVSIYTVRGWIKSGILKGNKIGGKTWRVSETEMKRFATERYGDPHGSTHT